MLELGGKIYPSLCVLTAMTAVLDANLNPHAANGSEWRKSFW